MKSLISSLSDHWKSRGDIEAIDRDLARRGLAPEKADSKALAPLDQLHVGGLESIIAFADWVGVPTGARLLDLGAGLGGPARFLAAERGARVHAVEVVPELHETAVALTSRLGLGDSVRHELAELATFAPAERYDVVWLEHVDMHVPGKRDLYARIRAALAPGGRAVWHDWLAGPGGEPRWPLFWSADGAISFLADEATFRADLAATGLALARFEPIPAATAGWLEAQAGALARALGKASAAASPDAARIARCERLVAETANALASVSEARLVPFFAEAIAAG